MNMLKSNFWILVESAIIELFVPKLPKFCSRLMQTQIFSQIEEIQFSMHFFEIGILSRHLGMALKLLNSLFNMGEGSHQINL